jgi:hypothetical protein
VGEDFLRKKTEQFVRRRGVDFMRLIDRHLFSGAPAREATETTGSLSSPKPLPTGTKLWSKVEGDGSVSFFAGRDRCVTVPETRARELRPLIEAGTSVNEVVIVDSALGQVRIRLTPITMVTPDER